ncbi:MAG: bifunctional riboflavin kinase/FAD synthetase [Actinomycetota bacterium]|nr:MAG: bifunctional riboflavin kinase/FAD synthetase [Actinomycetota bacterium]
MQLPAPLRVVPVVTGPHDLPASWRGAVVTIGVYDGVHRGHRAVIQDVVARARELGRPALVLTFDPHPAEVVRPGSHPAALSTLPHRVALLGGLGVDAVVVLPFTAEVMRQTAAEFIDDVLVRDLGVAEVVVGENFRFGNRAAGRVETLREAGARQGFAVRTVALAGADATWSSTLVRRLVADGDMAGAAEALGRWHRLEGQVVHGDARGRLLGFPTANLHLPPYSAVPADGVYAGYLVRQPYAAEPVALPAAVSIGTNPTFDGTTRRVEAYVLDHDDLDLYDEHVALDLCVRLRETLSFGTVEALVDQIGVDVARTRELLVGS